MPGLIDAYMQTGSISDDRFATNESLKNSYTPSSLLKDKIVGKRIDYIMYHPGSNVKVELKSYALPLPDRVPKQSFRYYQTELKTVIA